jgi:hypothetical protein
MLIKFKCTHYALIRVHVLCRLKHPLIKNQKENISFDWTKI